MDGFAPVGRLLIVAGVVLAGLGLLILLGPNIPGLGRLPGDIHIDRGSVQIYIPFGTMIVVSIILTILLNVFGFFGRDPAVVEAGVPVLRLIAFAMPALAGQIVFLSALRGAGDTRVPVLFNWFGFLCVRIPLAYLLTRPAVDLGPLGVVPGFDMGLYGAWIAMVTDIWVRGVFFVLRYAGGRWKRIAV